VSGASTSGENRAAYFIDGERFPAAALEPGLYVVATPIGNLADVTLRGLATFAAADLIACEDTRVTRVLLDRYGIHTPLIPYHDHNAAGQRPKLLSALAEGKAVALCSDAGTPLVSDPGYRLAVDAAAAGHKVVPVPGASALLAALAGAGLPTDTFLFAGFLPPKETARRKRLAELAAVPATLIFYEAPQRLGAALADMADVLGGKRGAAIGRELTKRFEEFVRGDLTELAARYGKGEAPKGEIVVLIGPPVVRTQDPEDVDTLLRELLGKGSVREAADAAADLTGLSRRDLYQRALKLKDGNGGRD